MSLGFFFSSLLPVSNGCTRACFGTGSHSHCIVWFSAFTRVPIPEPAILHASLLRHSSGPSYLIALDPAESTHSLTLLCYAPYRADRPKLRIPKSFEQLQDLNGLLKKYKTIYPYRTLYCFIIVYLFLQAFSLPGSMYLSILGGAVWGMARALLLVCTCVATGATLCYAISAALGPALLTMPKWRTWMDKWSRKVERQRSNLLSFLIVIR